VLTLGRAGTQLYHTTSIISLIQLIYRASDTLQYTPCCCISITLYHELSASLSLSIFSLAAWLTNCRTCGCEWQMWRCFGLHLYDCEQHRISDGRSSMALKESTYTVQNNTETECRHCSTVPSSLTGPRHPASPLKLASECARRRCASFAEKHSHSPTDLLTHSLACNTIGKRLRGMIVLWIDNNTSSFVTPLNISRRT